MKYPYKPYEDLHSAILDAILDGHYDYLRPEVKEHWDKQGNFYYEPKQKQMY